MLTKVVLIGLFIVLFLWMLYDRKMARDRLKEKLKREGYQLFTFNYTNEPPKEDFSGEHPEYEFREFYREHFSEFGRTFSDYTTGVGCPSTTCSNVQANSLTTINPISVGDKGFVMTLDMGQLPRQYHYRCTNKDSGVYTGLDEAMVFNGFDINHEKSSMPGHNPNVRGFASECQKTTSNCNTDNTTGKRTCTKETVDIGGTATDLHTLEHFMFKSTDVNDKKQGIGRYLDKKDRVVFIKLGRESRRTYIISDTPNKNLLYAYGRFGNYTYLTLNTGNARPDGLTLNLIDGYTYDNIFGNVIGVEKALYIAVQLDSDSDYKDLYAAAQNQVNTVGLKSRILDIVDGFVFVLTQEKIEDWAIWNFWGEVARDGGWYDARNQYNVLLQYALDDHNAYRIFSNQQVYAWPSSFADQDPLSGQVKYLRLFPYRTRYLVIENDVIPPLFAQPAINAPNVGDLKMTSSRGYGYVYPTANSLNARATSIFDQTPVLLKEPTSGVCSMTNVSHNNTAIPDFSDPNTSTYFNLGEPPQTLYPTGPSKVTSLYSSELLTLEMHRNSVAYGGFVMNTISTSSIFQSGSLNTMRNACTIESQALREVINIRKRLVDAGIAGNPDCSVQNRPSSSCVPSPIRRMYTAIGIINDRGSRENNSLVILTKLIEWNIIRWFAYTKGIPSYSKWVSKFSELFDSYHTAIRLELGDFLIDQSYCKRELDMSYRYFYDTIISPLVSSKIKNSNIFKTLSTEINLLLFLTSGNMGAIFSNSSIGSAMNQFLFDLFYCQGDTLRVRALLNSYDPSDFRKTWLYAVYPEDRKRSRIYFNGYSANQNGRWASGAFTVDPSQSSSSSSRSIVIPRKFTRGTDNQMTMVNSFPRVYSVLKFYSSSNDVIFTLFWAHIPLYPGCGYPTMNYEVTDKYGKPDFMNNNYSDNIFIFYLVGSESKWKDDIINNGIDPICEEDFYIESVYHGNAQCLRSIDNASKRLNCGNYVLFAEDGLVATVAPKNTNDLDTLGGDMGSFRIYCDDKGVFVYKRKISTTAEAANDYTVYSDYISVPGMKSCTGFSSWTPFRESNGKQTVFKSIRVEPPLLDDALDASKPPTAATPIQISATDKYRNLAQRREMIQTYAAFKHPTHPARVNTPVIKNINVLKAEGWRIVNVGGDGWVNPKTTYLNPYKVQQKDDYTVAPYYMNYKTKEPVDSYGGVVGTMVSKWGLPTQEKYITRGEWVQIEYPNALAIEEYRIRIPANYATLMSSIVNNNSNSKNTLPINRSISHWTFLGSNDDGVNKNWVLIDIQKDVDFAINTSPGVSESGNESYILDSIFICNLKTPMTFRFVRLVINGLHANNFENIFCLDWLTVREGFYYYPSKGESNPGINMSTSITPYGFDNNYKYTDDLQRPLVPMIIPEGPDFWTPPVNNATLSSTDQFGQVDYFKTRRNDIYGIGGASDIIYYSNQNMFVHNIDNKWSYKRPLASASVTGENWTANNVTREIGNPVSAFNSFYRTGSDVLKSTMNDSLYSVNIALGNYLFTWPELHLYMDTVAYSKIRQESATQFYNKFIKFGLYHYTKMVKDGTWRRSYSLSLDQMERFYEGGTITTYVYPCSVGNAGSNCQVYNNRIPVTGINNLRPDQEIADERFSWPQPYQGGSYLVSSSTRCISGQTCNSVGGNSTNVTPKYCFWIGDASTYSSLVNAGYPVQREFNMNIMFDGDTNIYNDVPSQSLGKLTLSNLDLSPLSQFYPPPALYRQKGWRLIDDPSGLTLMNGATRMKNAMISENNQVIFSFPDVSTALAYVEFDRAGTNDIKLYNGCQGPALVGTNVTVSCPVGKLKATSGAAAESTSHIRWGKWDSSVCRDSFGDAQIDAPFRPLPARCAGQSTCTISESDFGWSAPYPRDTSNDVIGGITRVSIFGVDGKHQFTSISEIRVWTSPTSYVHPDSVQVSDPVGQWALYDYGNYDTFWDPPFIRDAAHYVSYNFTNPINVYKIDVVGGHIPQRLAGMIVEAYSGGTPIWTSTPILRPDGGGDFRFNDNYGYKYISMWPGISRALFVSNSRIAYWNEFPITTYSYNPLEDSKITGAKTICINYENVSGAGRSLQVSDVKVYTSPKTMLSSSLLQISASSTLSGYPISNIIDGTPTFWHSTDERNPGLMITLPDNTSIYKITVGNRRDCCSSRMTGVNITIRNGNGRVLFKSDKFQNKDSTETESIEGHNGYNYYGVYPAFSSAVYPADGESTIASPSTSNLYQKRQWQVGFECDYSELYRAQKYQIPVGVTSRQLHENYYNLMKQVNNQTVAVFDIKDFPETLKWYGENMKAEILNSPQMKAEIRREEKEHYKSLNKGKREHYWDGDVCKPIGEVFEFVANGVLEGIYNPIVSGINKIGILRRGLGLTTQTVSVDWSCPIPGLGEAIAALVNAALAVGRAFVAAYEFVCQLGEALVGALINAGKYLFNRLQSVFTVERLSRFFRGFSNGLSGGFNLIGSLTNNFSWVLDAISNLGNLVVNLGNSVAKFFMNPSIDNFVDVIGNLFTLGIEAFIFVLEIGLSILTFFADLVGAFLGFLGDIGSWIANSVIGPIVTAFADFGQTFLNWIGSWF